MNLVIDASVWVSAAKSTEMDYLVSVACLQRVIKRGDAVFCPVIVLPECAAAIVRSTGSIQRAEELIEEITNFPGFEAKAITREMAHRSVEFVKLCGLRGADALYVATAMMTESSLIAWDKELNGPKVKTMIDVMSPQEWLATYA